jgi:uncharacterized caspase-like protein
MLAIGISQYQRKDLPDLSYADEDAQSLVELYLGQKGPLFGEVETRVLLNNMGSSTLLTEVCV